MRCWAAHPAGDCSAPCNPCNLPRSFVSQRFVWVPRSRLGSTLAAAPHQLASARLRRGRTCHHLPHCTSPSAGSKSPALQSGKGDGGEILYICHPPKQGPVLDPQARKSNLREPLTYAQGVDEQHVGPQQQLTAAQRHLPPVARQPALEALAALRRVSCLGCGGGVHCVR